jgi:methylmalonyl-CoA mutase cobalamin-binding subunit
LQDKEVIHVDGVADLQMLLVGQVQQADKHDRHRQVLSSTLAHSGWNVYNASTVKEELRVAAQPVLASPATTSANRRSFLMS